MSLKKKILVVALFLGMVLGYGAGFAHLKHHHRRCHGAAWGALEEAPPCGRAEGHLRRWWDEQVGP